MWLKQARARPYLGSRLYEGQLQILGQGRRQGVSLPLLHLRLRVEQIKLARTAVHEEQNDTLGFGRKVRRLRRQRVRGCFRRRHRMSLRREEMPQCDRPQPDPAITEKPAPATQELQIFKTHQRLPT